MREDGLPEFQEYTILRSSDLRLLVAEIRDLRDRVSKLEVKLLERQAAPVTALRLTPTELLLPVSGSVRYPFRVEEAGGLRHDLTRGAVVSLVDGGTGHIAVDAGCLVPTKKGNTLVRVRYETVEKDFPVNVHDCRKDLARAVALYQDGRSNPVSLTDRSDTPSSDAATNFVWAQDRKRSDPVSFPAGDPGFNDGVEQRLDDEVLAGLQPAGGHLFAALVLVRCLSKASKLFVLAPVAELRSGREMSIPPLGGVYFDVGLVVWEGRITELRFQGPSIIGIARVQL